MGGAFRLRSLLLSIALAVVALVAAATPAWADNYGPLYICGPDGWKASHASTGASLYFFYNLDGVGPQYYWRVVDGFGVRNGPLVFHDRILHSFGSGSPFVNTSQIDTSPPGCARYVTNHQ